MVTAAMKLRGLLFGRKAMTNIDSILKSRDITLLRKVLIVKAMDLELLKFVNNSSILQAIEKIQNFSNQENVN